MCYIAEHAAHVLATQVMPALSWRKVQQTQQRRGYPDTCAKHTTTGAIIGLVPAEARPLVRALDRSGRSRRTLRIAMRPPTCTARFGCTVTTKGSKQLYWPHQWTCHLLHAYFCRCARPSTLLSHLRPLTSEPLRSALAPPSPRSWHAIFEEGFQDVRAAAQSSWR